MRRFILSTSPEYVSFTLYSKSTNPSRNHPAGNRSTFGSFGTVCVYRGLSISGLQVGRPAQAGRPPAAGCASQWVAQKRQPHKPNTWAFFLLAKKSVRDESWLVYFWRETLPLATSLTFSPEGKMLQYMGHGGWYPGTMRLNGSSSKYELT
jgi:hypothetical protein